METANKRAIVWWGVLCVCVLPMLLPSSNSTRNLCFRILSDVRMISPYFMTDARGTQLDCNSGTQAGDGWFSTQLVS